MFSNSSIHMLIVSEHANSKNKPRILISPSSRKQLSRFPKMISCSIKVRVRVWLWLIKRQALITSLWWEVNSDLIAWRPDALSRPPTSTPTLSASPHKPLSPLALNVWHRRFQNHPSTDAFLKDSGLLRRHSALYKNVKTHQCMWPSTHTRTHISLYLPSHTHTSWTGSASMGERELWRFPLWSIRSWGTRLRTAA